MATFDLINLITLSNRKQIILDNEPVVDLTESVIQFNHPLTYSHPPVLVTKELEGRPWLISKLVYGTEEHYDLLCIFNGISNPLSIEEGMILVIPDVDSMKANLIDLTKDADQNQSKQAFVNKLSKKDKDRITQAMGKHEQKGEIRTPNMTKTGTKANTPVGGQIVLGTNISDSRCKVGLSAIQSITEEIRFALKKKLSKSV